MSEFQIEQQFTNANDNKLKKLASNSKGKLFYKDKIDNLIEELVQNEDYYTIQKSNKTEENLINWKWLLFMIVSLLSVEWFIRKYHGKI